MIVCAVAWLDRHLEVAQNCEKAASLKILRIWDSSFRHVCLRSHAAALTRLKPDLIPLMTSRRAGVPEE